MPFYGSIVAIHPFMDSFGSIDKSIFRLVHKECLLGRGEDCDIRVQLPKVSNLHCSVYLDQTKRAVLTCLSKDHETTKVNSKFIAYGNALVLKHKDIFTIGDQSFRWEYPKESQHTTMLSVNESDSEKVFEKSELQFENRNVNSSVKRNFEDLDDIMVSLKKRKEQIIKCLDKNEESCNDLKDLVIDEKDKNNQLIRKNIELSIELDFLKEKYRQIIIEKDMTIDILRKENYKKDQIIKIKNSEFQKVSNIVQEMSENETNADKVKSTLGIPVTNVVSFDSEIKQEIKEEIKTELLDYETTSSPPFYSNSQHWTSAR